MNRRLRLSVLGDDDYPYVPAHWCNEKRGEFIFTDANRGIK